MSARLAGAVVAAVECSCGALVPRVATDAATPCHGCHRAYRLLAALSETTDASGGTEPVDFAGSWGDEDGRGNDDA